MALLTKSTFLKGIQCEKYIYLDKYYKKEKDPVSEEQQEKYDIGHKIGELAKSFFPGGIDISLISRSRNVLVEETKKLLTSETSVFYEATFEFNDVLVMADVIIRDGDKWKVYEIKSGQKISDTNRKDAALQYYVINGSGLAISEFNLLCLNYPRETAIQTNPLEIPVDFFKFENVTENCIEKLSETDQKIKELKTTLAKPSVPIVDTGEHCTYPYNCEFIGFCNKSKNEINEGLFG